MTTQRKANQYTLAQLKEAAGRSKAAGRRLYGAHWRMEEVGGGSHEVVKFRQEVLGRKEGGGRRRNRSAGGGTMEERGGRTVEGGRSREEGGWTCKEGAGRRKVVDRRGREKVEGWKDGGEGRRDKVEHRKAIP